MSTRVAAFAIVAGGLVVAWHLLPPLADRRDRARVDVPVLAALDVRGVALAKEIARLRRHEEASAPPRHGRDLFSFVAAAPHAATVARTALPAPNTPPASPPRPALKLIGVAEDTAAGHPVRTAIISAPGQLYVVKEGEQVASRYGVARILPDVVELVDKGDASAIRLALK